MYKLIFTQKAIKQLSKLDKSIAAFIKNWTDKNLVNTKNPRQYGKSLKGNLLQYWRYKIGSYRILAEIKDKELIILAFDIIHRKDAYK